MAAYERRDRHRVGSTDLAWLFEILGNARAEEDAHPVDDARAPYLLLPSATRPWVVMPRLDPTATVRALVSGHRLMTRRQRAIRVLAGSRRLLPLATRPSRSAHVVPAAPAATTRPDLIGRLADRLGAVRPVVVLGEADPNRKPTLQLVDRAGRTVAYAKVGWNSGTRSMVDREGQALVDVNRRLPASGRVRAPDLLFAATYDDLDLNVVVTRPMPRRARRQPADSTVDDDTVDMIATATAGDAGVRYQAARNWGVWDDLRAGLTRVDDVDRAAVASVRRGVEAAVAALPATSGGRVGGWHGDLVPWNIASAGEQLWVWDWEHTAPDRPVGLDLLHHRFAVDRYAHRLSTSDAVRGVERVAHDRLPELGVSASAIPAAVVAYLALRWLRAAELAHGAAGWDTAVHPSLVTAISELTSS